MRNALHWATLLAAVAVVVAILVYPSYSQQTVVPMTIKPLKGWNILPPVEYDHTYDGDLTIKIVDTLEELRRVCKVENPLMLACSWHNAKSCMMILVKDEVMRQRGYTTGLLFRHEQGHCNGWPADHAGERAIYVGTSHVVPAEQRIGYGWSN